MLVNEEVPVKSSGFEASNRISHAVSLSSAEDSYKTESPCSMLRSIAAGELLFLESRNEFSLLKSSVVARFYEGDSPTLT